MGAELLRADRRTDLTKPTRALHYYGHVPENYFVTKIFYSVKKSQSAFMSGIKQNCRDVNEMANQHFYIMCVGHL